MESKFNKDAKYGSGQGKKIGWSGVADDNDTMRRKSKFKLAKGKGKGKKGKK